MEKELIAPCGMNCGICKYHYREKNTCPGCREVQRQTPTARFHCSVRECSILQDKKWMHCSNTCADYPCKRLKSLDKRYRTKYHMSMLDNLECINTQGVDRLLEKEAQKWACPQCNALVTCHGGMCLSCGYVKFKE